MELLAKIDRIRQTWQELADRLADPGLAADQKEFVRISREHNRLTRIVQKGERLQEVLTQIQDNTQMLSELDDPEMKELTREELDALQQEEDQLNDEIRGLLIPPDPNDSRNVILEIRAGTGGDEAALFAGDLLRMYTRYAEIRKWKIETIDSSPMGLGGFKDVTLNVQGHDVFGQLKYEAGVHRVQRVPATESSGRVHTSAATVAVLPEAEEVDIIIDPGDVRVDVYRSTGHGGQSVNTTDSAVRLTHLPTNTVVTCQDEKSQIKNKDKAMKVLRSRLYERKLEEEQAKRAAERRSQVLTGDRSAKIRTYNFPQSRVTDHRINLTLYKLEAIMNGQIEEIIEALRLAEKTEKLQRVAENS